MVYSTQKHYGTIQPLLTQGGGSDKEISHNTFSLFDKIFVGTLYCHVWKLLHPVVIHCCLWIVRIQWIHVSQKM